jgi:hypothetical protein
VRKAVMILLALLAIRLLPRALRREARALELLTLLFQMTAAAATSKTVAVETRTANLELATRSAAAKVAAQKGQTTAFSNLAQTETGSATVFGGEPTIQTGTPPQTGQYTVTSSGQTGGAAAHTHTVTLPFLNPDNHTHGYGHSHFNQVAGDFNNLVAQLNTMRSALIGAGLL